MLSKIMQIAIIKLLDIELDIDGINDEIKSLTKINNPEHYKKHILDWILTIEN